ncbi:MAG: hypothetical protein V7K50_15615 [Nostoc sp.]
MTVIIGTKGNDTLQGFSSQDLYDIGITTVTGGGGNDIF